MAHVVDVFHGKHQPHALTKRRQVNEILKSFDNKSNGRTSEQHEREDDDDDDDKLNKSSTSS